MAPRRPRGSGRDAPPPRPHGVQIHRRRSRPQLGDVSPPPLSLRRPKRGQESCLNRVGLPPLLLVSHSLSLPQILTGALSAAAVASTLSLGALQKTHDAGKGKMAYLFQAERQLSTTLK